MPQFEVSYPIAPRGRATSFTPSELPVDYALEMRNRFINAAGGAEKRQGMGQEGSTVSGTPDLDAIHELVKANGDAIQFVSGNGSIYRFDDPGYTLVKSGLNASAKLRSVMMNEKLIFVNGVDRNIFTEDGTTFKELQAIIERGTAGTGSTEVKLLDADVENWTTDTNVIENDLLYNATKDAYAVITGLASATASHTAITTANGAKGLGVATSAQEAGDRYEIIDLVELNVIPTETVDDNVADAGTGTTASIVAVSGVTFSDTDVRVGDYIRNTTQAAVTQVTAVGTNLGVIGVSGQTTGDSLIFLKSAMPIAKFPHVHFGRLYLSDARDLRKVRISGSGNPENFTTDAGTLDSNTFKFGEQQPQADSVQAMNSFQRFFVIAGKKNIYYFQGTNPIAEVSSQSTDFQIIGLFPQGVVSPDATVSIGNDLVFVTPDGVQSISLVGDASTLGRANLSEAIKTTLRDELEAASEAEILTWHYPRRSWFMIKVGSRVHVFNYTAFFGRDQLSTFVGGDLTTQRGSWSLFDGKFSRQNAYFVRKDATMLVCGPGGMVFDFDDGSFNDNGETYSTEYETGWLTLAEPRRDVRTKQGNYLKPIFDSGIITNYTINVIAGFNGESSDTIIVSTSGASAPIGQAVIGQSSIGGSSIRNEKQALRWRGEQAKFRFSTADQNGPDTLSRFTVYATRWGRR